MSTSWEAVNVAMTICHTEGVIPAVLLHWPQESRWAIMSGHIIWASCDPSTLPYPTVPYPQQTDLKHSRMDSCRCGAFN